MAGADPSGLEEIVNARAEQLMSEQDMDWSEAQDTSARGVRKSKRFIDDDDSVQELDF